MARLSARLQLPLVYAGLLLIVVPLLGSLAHRVWPVIPDAGALPGWIGVGLVVIGLLAGSFGPATTGPELELDSPVSGRWLAVNSPTTKVPSHGTHWHGQSYAVDLVYVPEGEWHTQFRAVRGGFRPPTEFPAFGQPVLAPADGVVTTAFDRLRDHRSRTSWLALGYLLVEGMIRQLGGAPFLFGNHVVLRLADGSHLTMAHLRHGSVRVHKGESVTAGQQIAECGNSGNSSEPHVHCQRQDHARLTVAGGLPWRIPGGLPATGEFTE